VADAADEIIGGAFAVGHGDYLDRRRLVVGAENELASGDFDVSYRASIAFQNSVHIEFAFAIWLECVVMAVYQERCPWHEARMHAGGFAGIELDEDEAVPAGAVAVGFGFQLMQEGFLELENVFDVHGGDERPGGGGGSIGEENVFKFVVAGRQDGSALVDLGGIEQIEHGEMLDGEDFVHAFETEAALAVEEVGDVGLLESGLVGSWRPVSSPASMRSQSNLRRLSCRILNFMGRSTAPAYGVGLSPGELGSALVCEGKRLLGGRARIAGNARPAWLLPRFPQGEIVNPTLTEKIHSYTIAEL